MSTTPTTTQLQAEQQRPFRPLISKLRDSFGYSTPISSSSSSSSDFSDVEDTAAALDSARSSKRKLPQCWGHRGASAAFPENTLASFKQACLDGAEGIESDVHVSLDGTIVMFHDAYLNRTTNGKGTIKSQAYKDGIDKLRTTKLPAQRICTFAETLELLMEESNRHVVLNVDVKLDNDPEELYPLMKAEIESIPGWMEDLAPRIILGLWHAKYIEPAQRILPYCGLAHIGVSPSLARKYFWNACSAFSMNFASLVGREGQQFVKACKENGKELYVWTVNDRKEMIQCVRWGIEVVLTDKTAAYLSLRDEMSKNWNDVVKEVGPTHSWSNIWYFSAVDAVYQAYETFLLQRTAGPLAVPLPLASQGGGASAVKVGGGSDTTVS